LTLKSNHIVSSLEKYKDVDKLSNNSLLIHEEKMNRKDKEERSKFY
jgi:hypothetical protein